jgi:3'-phosphoadenosine 5'-phosphosulfate sulfotransferase (PAPS reductase)/FAD synthetase
VWARIGASGVPHHPAYDLGMPRLSCKFCVLASRSALVRAAQIRPDLAAQYAGVEERIGHSFRNTLSMREIIDAARTAGVRRVDDWAA